MSQYDINLRDYWRITKKRKTTIIFMVMLVGLCSYGFAKFQEPKPLYEVSSAIKIDQFSNMGSILTGGYWRQSENMVTHAYILTSFPVLCQTAGALKWFPKTISEKDVQHSTIYLSVIRRLKAMVEAEHEDGTNIINIRVESEDAREAEVVANALAQSYRDYNIQEKNKKTFETKAFIEEQLRLTSNRLRQAENELKTFKESHGVISLDTQTQNTLNRLYAVEAEYEKAKNDKEVVQSQIEMIESVKFSDSVELKGSFFPATPDSPVHELKTKLSALLLKRQNLLIDFTVKHPEVREVDAQMRLVLDESIKDLQSLLNAHAAREEDILQRIHQLRRDNLSLPGKGLQLVRLQRDVELQESLYSQLKEKHQETLIQESGKLEEVTIVRPAIIPEEPFNVPSKIMIVCTGIVMGLILGIVFSFLAEVFDTSMGTIEDVEELLNVPVLGIIPQLNSETKGKRRSTLQAPENDRKRELVTHYEPESMGAEAFRALRTNLQFLRLGIKGKLFLITSSFVQEGKTLNVVNLALSMAQSGNKILLVDGDLRKPQIHRVFGLSKEPGITDYVLGNYHWQEVVNTISDVMLGDFGIDDILKTPGIDNVNIVVAGTTPPNPTEIISSSRFREFLTQAGKVYDFVFIDAPPILPVADAAEIAPLVDGVFMVYTVGRIGRGVLKRAKSTLDNVDGKVLGIILNEVKPEAGPAYFKYHSQYYYGTENKADRVNNKFKKCFQNHEKPAARRIFFKIAMLILAWALLALVIYWQNLHHFIFKHIYDPLTGGWLVMYWQNLHHFILDWLASFKGLFISK